MTDFTLGNDQAVSSTVAAIVTPSLIDHDLYKKRQHGANAGNGPRNAFFSESATLPQVPAGWPRAIGTGVTTSAMTRTTPAGESPVQVDHRLDWACFGLTEAGKDSGVLSNVSRIPNASPLSYLPF